MSEPILWDNFDYPDNTTPESIGWTQIKNSTRIFESAMTYGETETNDARVGKDFGLRPEVVEVTVDANQDSSGLNLRYSSAGFYRIRWNKSNATFSIDQIVTGGSTAVNVLASVSMPGSWEQGDDGTAYDLRVTDIGSTIKCEVLGYPDKTLTITQGVTPNFDNLWADYNSHPTSVVLYLGGIEPSSFRSIRVWDVVPTYNLTDDVEPIRGTVEKSRHSAIFHNGKTYISWLTPWGDLYIKYYDHGAQSWSEQQFLFNIVNNSGRYARDDHNYPTITIADDNHIVLFCAVHQGGGPAFWSWRSNEPESITDGFTRHDFTLADTGGVNPGYPTPIVNNNGDILVFYRADGGSTSGNWYYVKSTDNGQTWSNRVAWGDGDNGLYCFVEQNPNNRDHLVCFTYESRGYAPNRYNVYHMESLDGGSSWQKVDGTSISLPAHPSEMDFVFDTDSGGHQCRVTGINIRDGKGACFIAYKSDPDTEYRYCWWDGSSWQNSLVTPTQTWWDGNNESELPGGGDLHPNDPDEMVLSQPVNGVYEIQIWRTDNGGLTWAKTKDITSGSDVDNARPVFVKNLNNRLPMFWYKGEYKGNDGYIGAWDGYDDAVMVPYFAEVSGNPGRRFKAFGTFIFEGIIIES